MTKILAAILAATILVSVSCSGSGAPTPTTSGAPAMETDEQKTFYALGLALSGTVGQFNLSESELQLVVSGFSDGVLHREAKVKLEEFRPRLGELARARAAMASADERKRGADYLEKAASEAGAVKLPSGVVYLEVAPGTGDSPAAADVVKVHYTGSLIDGKVFDSSVQRGQPAEFGLDQVIRCWGEGVQRMKVGGKSKLVCPADMAYGDQGAPPNIKPGATIQFEVELLEVKKK